MNLSGDYFDTLANQIDIEFGSNAFFKVLYELLIDHSFQPLLKLHEDILLACMPKFAEELSKPGQLSLEHALKIAELMGFKGIHELPKDDEIRLIFEASFVIILYIGIRRAIYTYHRPIVKFYSNYSSFWDEYSSYSNQKGFDETDIDNDEQKKLVLCANIMKTVLLLVPNCNYKRTHVLDIVIRLSEGKKKKYITGSGQSKATTRRIIIYQKEAAVTPTTRKRSIKETSFLPCSRQPYHEDIKESEPAIYKPKAIPFKKFKVKDFENPMPMLSTLNKTLVFRESRLGLELMHTSDTHQQQNFDLKLYSDNLVSMELNNQCFLNVHSGANNWREYCNNSFIHEQSLLSQSMQAFFVEAMKDSSTSFSGFNFSFSKSYDCFPTPDYRYPTNYKKLEEFDAVVAESIRRYKSNISNEAL